MNRTALLRITTVVFAWFVCHPGARGEDLTTTNGKAFQDIEVKELDCDSITVSHRGGVTKILLKDLSSEMQMRFSPSELFRELRLKTDELRKAKSELAAVRGETAKPVKTFELSARDAASLDSANSHGLAKPMPPISTLSAIKASDVVSAEEIAHHYKTDPRSADLRYRKKVFRVQGKVERFDEKLFVRKTSVILESSERSQRVVCEMPFPDEFSAVYSKNGGQILIGVSNSRRAARLMEVGETVVFKGRCTGLQSNGVVFIQCEPVAVR